jgi:hypothetical protein
VASVRFCDEWEGGFGWISDDRLPRTSHALAARGGVWLVDAVDAPGAEERVRALGEPRGVIQLLDRHSRDCAVLAARLGVPHFEVPFQGIPGSTFDFVPVVRRRVWREVALWWPEGRTLVCADALGTLPYFCAPGERLGVHPGLRLRPPHVLAGFDPVRVLVGHGEGLEGVDAAAAVRDAVRSARRRLPLAYLNAARDLFRRG